MKEHFYQKNDGTFEYFYAKNCEDMDRECFRRLTPTSLFFPPQPHENT